MNYTCPICGYNRLEIPPLEFNICPSCGTEFGFDDLEYSNIELTTRWIQGGMRWWSRDIPIPSGWNPRGQLKNVLMFYNLNATTTSEEKISLNGNVMINPAPGIFNFFGKHLPVDTGSDSSSNYALATL